MGSDNVATLATFLAGTTARLADAKCYAVVTVGQDGKTRFSYDLSGGKECDVISLIGELECVKANIVMDSVKR